MAKKDGFPTLSPNLTIARQVSLLVRTFSRISYSNDPLERTWWLRIAKQTEDRLDIIRDELKKEGIDSEVGTVNCEDQSVFTVLGIGNKSDLEIALKHLEEPDVTLH